MPSENIQVDALEEKVCLFFQNQVWAQESHETFLNLSDLIHEVKGLC